MSEVLTETTEAFLDAATAEPSPLLREMTEYGRERGFPVVGPQVGRLLRVVARLADARRVFEFGSGFGYSAAWFLGALPDDAEIVLTDRDEDDLADAREFLSRGDYDAAVHYEVGDAMATFERYDGPFDVVLIDVDKSSYVDAFERARDELAPGGVVVTDNVLGAGSAAPDDVLAALRGENPGVEIADDIAAYVEHVRGDAAFDTSFVPLGEGVALSVREE